MASLKNRVFVLLLNIVLLIQSCEIRSSINNNQFIGVYEAGSENIIDTLIINSDFSFFHVYHEIKNQYVYSQYGKWKLGVNGSYELINWKADSISFGGADIFPKINRISKSIRFAYPLVTSEGIDYIKVNKRQ